LFSFEIARTVNAGLRVVHNRAVVKNARRENRYRRKTLSIGFGTDVGRHRELADVVLEPPYHLAECLDQHRHIDVIDLKGLRLNRLMGQRCCMPVGSKHGFQFHLCNNAAIMLKTEHSDLITQTGPGTPMGQLFRRYWMPALLAEELPENGCPPVRVKLLSER